MLAGDHGPVSLSSPTVSGCTSRARNHDQETIFTNTMHFVCILNRSDLACCSGKSHDGYGEPSDAWAQLKVGSCDWHIRKFYCPPQYVGRCGSANNTLGGFIELDNNAVKFADAWATW